MRLERVKIKMRWQRVIIKIRLKRAKVKMRWEILKDEMGKESK